MRPARKKAVWLVAPLVEQYAEGECPEQGILACPQASARLRMAVAAAEWRRAGHEVEFLSPEHEQGRANPGFNADSICIVHKFMTDSEYGPWVEVCAAAKRNGSRLVVDICDSPFHERPPHVSRFYGDVLKLCDAVTVNSEKMAEVIAPFASQRPFVIEDAVLSESMQPGFAPGPILNLLWFGHPRNLPTLGTGLGSIVPFAKTRRCRLVVVTESGCGAERLTEKIQSKFAPALEAQFIPWSLASTANALRDCDLVVIPGDFLNPFYACASANRVVEALAAGRFPIAIPLQSYLPYSAAAWLGNDLAEGIEWAVTNPAQVLARISQGQILVREKCAPDYIGRRWRRILESTAN